MFYCTGDISVIKPLIITTTVSAKRDLIIIKLANIMVQLFLCYIVLKLEIKCTAIDVADITTEYYLLNKIVYDKNGNRNCIINFSQKFHVYVNYNIYKKNLKFKTLNVFIIVKLTNNMQLLNINILGSMLFINFSVIFILCWRF